MNKTISQDAARVIQGPIYEGICYNCKKVNNCETFEKIRQTYSNASRSFRRKGYFTVEECGDFEPVVEGIPT